MGRSRVHSREFKLEACRQVASGEKRPAQVCREHQLSEGVLVRWRHEYQARGEAAFTPQALSEGETLARRVAELERFCGQLALENAVLEKALVSIEVTDPQSEDHAHTVFWGRRTAMMCGGRSMLRPTYPIETARLLLRPFAPDDLDALYAIQSRQDVMRYLYGEPRSRAAVRDALAVRACHPTLETAGDTLFLAMERRDSGTVIGDVSLHWLSAEHEQGEIGFVLHPDHHGGGFAREAAIAMLRLGFEGLGLHRIIGRCDARNDASARLMERLGMRREAHFRENERFKGEWGDEYLYAMLAAEWGTNDGR